MNTFMAGVLQSCQGPSQELWPVMSKQPLLVHKVCGHLQHGMPNNCCHCVRLLGCPPPTHPTYTHTHAPSGSSQYVPVHLD